MSRYLNLILNGTFRVFSNMTQSTRAAINDMDLTVDNDMDLIRTLAK